MVVVCVNEEVGLRPYQEKVLLVIDRAVCCPSVMSIVIAFSDCLNNRCRVVNMWRAMANATTLEFAR